GNTFNGWLERDLASGMGVICVDGVDTAIADHIVRWNALPRAHPPINSKTVVGKKCCRGGCTKRCEYRTGYTGRGYWHHCTGCHNTYCDTCGADYLANWSTGWT